MTTAVSPFSSSVQFYGTQVPPLGPNYLQVYQEEFKHDIAVMQFWADDVDADSYASGAPMVAVFGRPPVSRIFYGYVNHPTRTNNALSTVSSLTDRNSTTITCMGASWFMKQAGNRSWEGMTASQIVQAVADIFGLAADITPHETVWPSVPMAGMSYWQLCVMLAKRIGYTFYCSGVQLVFKPRQTDPSNLSGLIASYNYRADPGSLPVFTPTLGATSPAGGQLVDRQSASINPRTNQVIYSHVSGNPSPTILGSTINTPIFRKTEHFTVSSQEEADAKTAGAGLSNQLYLTATALANGNPLISQGSLIYVMNANGSQNGLWFVEKAVQLLNTSTYSMDLCLGRDSLGAAAVIDGTSQIKTPPIAALSGGVWRAQ